MKKLLLIASFFSVVTLSAQTVTKKVSLVKGQQLEQQSQLNMNITQEMGGQVMEMKMESNATSLVEVKEDAEIGYTIANTLKKVLMNVNGMGQEMKFDSDKKEDMDGQMGEPYRDRIGKPKEYAVGRDGIVKEVKFTETKKDDAGNMFGSMMSGSMADEKPGSTFNALANIPASGAKVGESWSDSTKEDGTSSVTMYTLKEVNGNDGVVSLDSDVTVSKELEQQGMTMQMEMKGKTTGEYVFDVATGIIKSRKATTKASGTVDVAGQTIPMSLETTLVSTVSKK